MRGRRKQVDMYSTGGAVSGGEGLYWKYESWLKKWIISSIPP